MNSVNEIMNLLGKYQHAQVLITANKLGIFSLLESGIKSTDYIANRLSISKRGVVRLVETLEEMGLIQSIQGPKNHTKIKATKTALQCFGKNGLIKNWTMHHGTLYDLWDDLPESLRKGKPILKNTHDIDVQAYARGLTESYLLQPKKLHKIINLKGKIKMLDMGGGAGHYTILAAMNNPQLYGTIFDRSEIIKITKQMIRKYHLEKRISILEGDAIKSNWKGGYDVILLSNILHGKSESEVKQLLLKVFQTLTPDGRILINEWIKGSHIDASLFNLTMLLCTKNGQVWDRKKLFELVREAGFTHPKYKRLDQTNGVIEAWKPRN